MWRPSAGGVGFGGSRGCFVHNAGEGRGRCGRQPAATREPTGRRPDKFSDDVECRGASRSRARTREVCLSLVALRGMSMKRPALIAVGLAAAALATTQGWADNTDQSTVTVNGTIVAPLTLSVAQNLVMPHIVRPSSGEPAGEVVLTCGSDDTNNTVTYTNRSNPFAHGVSTDSNQNPQSGSANIALGNSTGTCARVTLVGQGSYFYIPTVSVLTQPSATGVTLSTLACREGGTTLTSGSSRKLPAGGSTTRTIEA